MNTGKRNKQAKLTLELLALQNIEMERLTSELTIANKELAFQSDEKGKRATELLLANKELAFQNEEKEKRASELLIANKELAFQNEEKGKRATELLRANKELESFTFISSHDLQEPLRKIQIMSDRILSDEYENLSEAAKKHFLRIQSAALHMQNLINDLLVYSRTSTFEKKFENTDLFEVVEYVKTQLNDELKQKEAVIIASGLCRADIIPFQFRQLLQNLISNALKFSNPNRPICITIKGEYVKCNEQIGNLVLGNEYCYFSVSDNGIGFDIQYKELIFEIFQQLHSEDKYEGTGMGLTIVKKIVENHNGYIAAYSKLNEGSTFDIYIPIRTNSNKFKSTMGK